MRILKKPGSHLRMEAIRNLSLGIVCLVGFTVIFLVVSPTPFQVDVGNYSISLTLLLPLLLILAFFFFFPSYSNYKRGVGGENEVIKALSSLNDEYGLLSDVTPRGGFGNIDHIVLGPNGIFVIETKNWRGEITFIGDECQSKYTKRDHGSSRLSVSFERRSPSKQAKANALRIRELVESLAAFGPRRICVEAIVIFTNPNAILNVKEPPAYTKILRTPNLVDFIKNVKPEIPYSPSDIEMIGKKILNA